MGIQGLIPFLKDIHERISISEYSGKKVAIDAYCWLHRGAYACAYQLAVGTKADQYVKYVLKRVNMLLFLGVTPILVFDGGYLPSKAAKEAERRSKRKEFRTKGRQYLAEGDRSKAVDCFQKCIDITPEMAKEVMDACKQRGVQCIVAPYEADAQLAYLQKENLVQLVITEDSDLMVFGCTEVLFKMDENGEGIRINLQRLGEVKGMQGFTMESFRHMCVLSGCDYLPSISGMGLFTARKLLVKYGRDPVRVIKSMQVAGTKKVPENYIDDFKKADLTFLHQVVFDPIEETWKRLNELSDGLLDEELAFTGMYLSPRKSKQISQGKINPIDYGMFESKIDVQDSLIPWGKEKQPKKGPGHFGGKIAFQPRLKPQTQSAPQVEQPADDSDVVGQYKSAETAAGENQKVASPFAFAPPSKRKPSRRSLFQKEHVAAVQATSSQVTTSNFFAGFQFDPVQEFRARRQSLQKQSVFSCLEEMADDETTDNAVTMESVEDDADVSIIEPEDANISIKENEDVIETEEEEANLFVSCSSGVSSSGGSTVDTKRPRRHTVGLSKKFKADIANSNKNFNGHSRSRSVSEMTVSRKLGLKKRSKKPTKNNCGSILSWAFVQEPKHGPLENLPDPIKS
eukprot:m.20057 g.20057  ORF g.20057 m.20057 type:complete len:628 (+) comp27964_c0_seq1:1398-3281(+)